MGRPDWQVCGPIPKVKRRSPTRLLFSSVSFSLNANKRGRGVGRGRRGCRTPGWDSPLPHPPNDGRVASCLATPQARGAGPARMGFAGALELGFDFACVPFPWRPCNLAALAATTQFIPERRARRGEGGEVGEAFCPLPSPTLSVETGPCCKRYLAALGNSPARKVNCGARLPAFTTSLAHGHLKKPSSSTSSY